MKLLFFYPDSPLQASQGNTIRVRALLDYFKSRGHEVDFVSEASDYNSVAKNEELKQMGLVSKYFLLRSYQKKKHKLGYLFKISIPNTLKGRMRQFYRVKPGQQAEFNQILQQNEYDVILITYACWAGLIANNTYIGKAQLWVDTHDFLTAQFQTTRGFQLGKSLETEMQLLHSFDKILVISPEEHYVFSQFLPKPVEVVTHAIPQVTNQAVPKEFDFLFVGSDNHHNRRSIQWFFEAVYPLLPASVKILIIGKVTEAVGDYPNVTKVPFAPSIAAYYQQSKVALCPMVSGTGLKIKVVEALSYGIPVVCQPRGVDGLWNKSANGCLVASEAADFAKYCLQLLEDENFYQTHHQLAVSYFKKHHDSQTVYREFDRIFSINGKEN